MKVQQMTNEASEIMMAAVDPAKFRERLIGLIGEVFDAAKAQVAANEWMDDALNKLDAIGGRSFAVAIHELATEPRRVCSQCVTDFMANDTGTDRCAKCESAARSAALVE